jgi:putative ABC transport system ATP-binding protein
MLYCAIILINNMEKTKIIEVKNLHKEFPQSNEKLIILNDVNFDIYTGEKVAIVGPSGSGKSTFLSLLAGLDKPEQGSTEVDGKNIIKLSTDKLSKYRNETISIIFQSFELISPFTVTENIKSPLDIRGKHIKGDSLEIKNLIESVGLSHRENAFPSTLSGGEKQRTAIARALASDAKIILADEPTGNLDRNTGEKIIELLLSEVEKRGKTLIIITHDMNIAARMDRVFEIKDKMLYENKSLNNKNLNKHEDK